MMTEDFAQIAKGYPSVARCALEAVAVNSAIGAYKFEGGKFEMDESSTGGLTEQEQKLVDQFSDPTDNKTVEVVVRQANEGFLDSLMVSNVRQVTSLISNSMTVIEKNVKAYKQMVTKMNKTLVASEKQINKLYHKNDVNISVDFGAYSRFFHIGNRVTDTDKSFVEGLFAHRAASEWCAMNSPQVIKDLGKLVESIFPNIDKEMPNISEAIIYDAIDKAGEIFDKHYAKDSLVGLSNSGYSVSAVRIPKQAQYLKDVLNTVKGAMFDGNVLLYNQPKKRELHTLTYACTILRDDDMNRSEIKGFDIVKAKELQNIVSHGAQISSNTLTTLDVLEKFVNEYLNPLKEAVNYLTKNSMLISSNDAKLLTHYAAMARLLNDAVMHPLLSTVWIDTRLCRVIAGMAEAYFVRNPRDRTIFAKDIRAL